MANMSYCRFENTYRDLVDCQENMADTEELSETEQHYRKEIIRVCLEIAEEYCDEED